MKVSDTKALTRVMEQEKLEYKLLGDDLVDIYGDVKISKLVLALNREHCEVLSMKEHDETLEGYYVSLVGGDWNE